MPKTPMNAKAYKDSLIELVKDGQIEPEYAKQCFSQIDLVSYLDCKTNTLQYDLFKNIDVTDHNIVNLESLDIAANLLYEISVYENEVEQTQEDFEIEQTEDEIDFAVEALRKLCV